MTDTQEKRYTRLQTVMQRHAVQKRIYDKHTLWAWKEYVGDRHAQGGAGHPVPVNFLKLMTDVLVLALAGATPKVFVDTRKQPLKAFAFKLCNTLNTLIRRKIPFRETMRGIVADSVFGMGIIKKGRNLSRVEMGGVWHDAFQTYGDRVAQEAFLLDLDAFAFEECTYLSDCYRVRRKDALECGYLDPDAVRRLPQADAGKTPDSMSDGDAQQAVIGTTGGEFIDEMVWLRDVYLPKDRLMLTFPSSNWQATQLRKAGYTDFDGPEGGPYDVLGYKWTPRSVLPVSPVSDVIHLHEQANSIWRKINNQARRQKTLTTVPRARKDDAKALGDAPDGRVLGLDSRQEEIVERSFGGVSQGLLVIFQQMMTLFNYFAYNVEAIGGLRQQAGTLGQEQFIQAGANRRIGDMIGRVTDFAERTLYDFAFYLWDDVAEEIEFSIPIKGTNQGLTDSWKGAAEPDARQGEFPDYEIGIVPYSMAERSPESLYAITRQLVGEVIMPMLPIMESQGVRFDIERFLERVGHLVDVDMSDLVTLTGRVAQEQQEGAGVPRPARTERVYTRRGAPGMSQQGAAQQLAMTMGSTLMPGMVP